MRILLSNDDGYFAPGLEALAQELSRIASITVVAPERDRSGASHSLTLDRPLSLRKAPNGFLFVNGTPTDCVHLAITGGVVDKPDFVVSGINHGANMGDDTIYSGTVAAAMEGFLLGVPAIAVSLVGKEAMHFAAAARVVRELVERCAANAESQPYLLNVNVPDKPFEQLQPGRITRLGKRHKAEPVIRASNPRGETVYWVGGVGGAQDAGEGTDFYAIGQGAVSVTPLQVDLTHFALLDRWAESLSLKGIA